MDRKQSPQESENAEPSASSATAPILRLPDDTLKQITRFLSYANQIELRALSIQVMHSSLCDENDIADKKRIENGWREAILKDLSSRPELLLSYLIVARAKSSGKSVVDVKLDPPSYKEVYLAHKKGVDALAARLSSCSFFEQRISTTEYFINNCPHFYPDCVMGNREFLATFPTSHSIDNFIASYSNYFKAYPKHAEHLHRRFLELTQIVELKPKEGKEVVDGSGQNKRFG